MKIIKFKNFIISFGFNPLSGLEENGIFWNDPESGKWIIGNSTMAGSNIFKDIIINPEFTHNSGDVLVIYQPGLCIEMTFIGRPMIFDIKLLQP